MVVPCPGKPKEAVVALSRLVGLIGRILSGRRVENKGTPGVAFVSPWAKKELAVYV